MNVFMSDLVTKTTEPNIVQFVGFVVCLQHRVCE